MYNLKYEKKFLKKIKDIPKKEQKEIKKEIKGLKKEPKKKNTKDLNGKYKGYRRLRVGNYRVIYSIKKEELVILIINVGHRKEIYKILS